MSRKKKELTVTVKNHEKDFTPTIFPNNRS